MAKNIIMNVLTSLGYEPMYPFNPGLVLSATLVSTSTSSNYNITISGIPVPLTNSYGNNMGIICFIPNVTNVQGATLTLNSDIALPIVFSNGATITDGVLISGRLIFLKYYNNKFYLIEDKSQIGLSNVDNTSDLNKPISTATQNALNNKLNIPQLIPANTNLNTYQTAGLYYNPTDSQVATITNAPVQLAFSLFVERHAGVKQTFTAYTTSGARAWSRNYYNGTWGSWQQQAFVLFGTANPLDSNGADGNIYIKYS